MKEYKYTIDGNKYEVAINEVNDTTAKVTVNGAEYTVEWEKPVEEKPVVKVKPAVAAKPAATEAPAAAPAAPVSGNAIKTPLPGVIIDVKVAVGDIVKKKLGPSTIMDVTAVPCFASSKSVGIFSSSIHS